MRKNHHPPPPPSTPTPTPTPRRFLLARTPAAAAATQFRSTPRFGRADGRAARGACAVEDVDDGEMVSSGYTAQDVDDQPSPGDDTAEMEDAGDPGRRPRRPHGTQDSIEVESDVASTSQGDRGLDAEDEASWESRDASPDPELGLESEVEREEADASGREEESGGREAKRRKLSISPVEESSPLTRRCGGAALDFGLEEEEEVASAEGDGAVGSPSGSFRDGSFAFGEVDEPGATTAAEGRHATNQPVFRPAPRFKPADADASEFPAAAVFSPQRRGDRYVPGGLAAGLQALLSDVKSWEEEEDGTHGTGLAIAVEEVRPGRHMQLVQGRSGDDEASRRFILAGQGRPTGLERVAAAVRAGGVVTVRPPVWDVELDGQKWTVACDWSAT
ncbi:hypothetical protein CDD83_6874 [Cordyceps sp. RAO-2017]|nr:hypothetical protein CDD83_6874 [Cordyceps sp. RAO-2017]